MLIESFSNNIYAELSGYDLKNEYKKTKTELAHFKFSVKKKLMVNDLNTQNFLKKLQDKLDNIQAVLMMKLKKVNINEVNDTMDGFYRFIESRKSDKHHRLRSEYSYDIRDNNKYKRSKKGEKQVAMYLAKQLQMEVKKYKNRGNSELNKNQIEEE